MKKNTSDSYDFSKRLTQYGALSLAIAGVADASGQIIYTDVSPDIGGTNVSYALDLNNDAVTDFNITHFTGTASSPYVALAVAPYSGNGILGLTNSSYVYPFALSAGAPISNAQTTWNSNSNYQTMSFNSCAYTYSNWCNQTDKYLGLRFTFNGNFHYGWARLDNGATSGNWVIKDYAYNSTPGAAINAGQTTLGLDDFSLNKIKITSLNKSIGLYNLSGNIDYQLISMNGKVVLKGETNQHAYVIEAKGVSSGIYIVELSDAGTNTIIRKKVVL